MLEQRLQTGSVARSRSPRSSTSRPNSRASPSQPDSTETGHLKPGTRSTTRLAPVAQKRTLYTSSGIWGWVSEVESESDMNDEVVSRPRSRPVSEGHGRLPLIRPHSAWNSFADEIKSIDDQTVYFRNRIIKLKYSDTFKLVLDEIDYTPPSLLGTPTQSHSAMGYVSPLPLDSERVLVDICLEDSDGDQAVTPNNSPDNTQTIQVDTNDTACSSSQRDTIKGNEEVQQSSDRLSSETRNALYDRYLRKPNAWLDGLSYIPPELTEKYGKYSSVEMTDAKRVPKRKTKSAHAILQKRR